MQVGVAPGGVSGTNQTNQIRSERTTGGMTQWQAPACSKHDSVRDTLTDAADLPMPALVAGLVHLDTGAVAREGRHGDWLGVLAILGEGQNCLSGGCPTLPAGWADGDNIEWWVSLFGLRTLQRFSDQILPRAAISQTPQCVEFVRCKARFDTSRISFRGGRTLSLQL